MKVLVCGGRDFNDYACVFDVLDAIEPKITHIIHGGARGADHCAHEWALLRSVDRKVFHANWTRDGRAAGPIRNQQMLDEAKPDLVVAFPGGRGTADMVRRARAAGVKVIGA